MTSRDVIYTTYMCVRVCLNHIQSTVQTKIYILKPFQWYYCSIDDAHTHARTLVDFNKWKLYWFPTWYEFAWYGQFARLQRFVLVQFTASRPTATRICSSHLQQQGNLHYKNKNIPGQGIGKNKIVSDQIIEQVNQFNCLGTHMDSDLGRSVEQSVAFLVKTTTDKIEVLQSYVIQSLTKDVVELTTLNEFGANVGLKSGDKYMFYTGKNCISNRSWL